MKGLRETALLRQKWVTLITLMCVPCAVLGEEEDENSSPFRDPLDGRFDASEYLAENAFGFLPVPIIITDPAVDGGLGVVGMFFNESEEAAAERKEAMRSSDNAGQHLLPPSVSAAAAAYTGNGSWFVGGGHMGFFKEGRIRYMGGGGYGDVNLDFFGFGEIEFPQPVSLNTKAAAVIQSVKFKVGDLPVFVGVAQRFVSATISPANLDFLDDSGLPPETVDQIRDRLNRDVQTSALGFVGEFDSRDNFFSPRKGYRYNLDYYWYRDWLGSDIDYEYLVFEGLNYWELTDKFRLGLRVQADYAATESLLPPFATPSIQLRGIQAARYQGNYVGVVETEFTWQIDSRWAALAFAGVGRAANDWDAFRDAENRITRGAGFRYLIARRYGFDMGLDVARGPEDTVWYIQAGSAWGR